MAIYESKYCPVIITGFLKAVIGKFYCLEETIPISYLVYTFNQDLSVEAQSPTLTNNQNLKVIYDLTFELWNLVRRLTFLYFSFQNFTLENMDPKCSMVK